MNKQIKSVIITGPGFQDEEFVYPYYRLKEENYSVDVATKDGQNVFGKYGVPARATMKTADLDADIFDLVILPGGFEAPDRVRLDQNVLKFIKSMDEKKKIIAAICHGPWILISSKILTGRKVTAYESIADDVINAGAIYINAEVVVDENIITAPHYRDNGIFMKTVISKFKKNE